MRDLHARMLAALLGGEGLRGIAELAASALVRKALGDHIFERYVDLKREEWEEYRVQVSSWELERYLPVL